MTTSDPSIPLYALALWAISTGLGYLAGTLRHRSAHQRRRNRYGSIITRTR